MAGILWRVFLLALLFHYKPGPRFNNSTDYASVFQGDADYNENSPLLSFDTILENGVNQFGHGLCDPKRPSDIYLEAFAEEPSFVHDGRDATPLPSEVVIEIGLEQESVWPGFADLKPFLHQAQERFRTYLSELFSQLGFGLGAQDHTTPCEIEETETVVEETSFVYDGQDATPLPSAEVQIEIDPVQESAWPGFTVLKVVFHQTQDRLETFLRELLSQLGFGLGAQDHTTPCEIEETETVVEETSFVYDGRDATPLPSAEVQIEIDPVQDSVWPGFTVLKVVFHQTQDRLETYLRELLSQLGFGLGAQDHTTPCEIEETETVVQETSFVHDGRDATPLPSAEVVIEIGLEQESVWPRFADLKVVLHQAQECFRTYLRELFSQLGFGLGAQDHTTPCEIEETETVVEETSFVYDGRDATPLPSAEVQIEIDPVQESVWPGFTVLKVVFHLTQDRLETYLRELLSQLGFGLDAQDHTTPCEIEKAETVVEETFVRDGRDATPLPSAEVVIEIGLGQESVWLGLTDLKPILHQSQERFRTYLRELFSQLGFGLGAQDHTTPCEIEKTETVVEETSFVQDSQDPTPLPSPEVLIEINPVQDSVWPGFTVLKVVFHQTQEFLETYLRELLSQLGFGLDAQGHTTPCEIEKAETVVEETSFVHNGQDATPLPSADLLIEIDLEQESVWPRFADLKVVLHQAQECFRTYLRELFSQMGFGLGAQDHTAPCEIEETETVVEETSFVYDGRDATPLPSAEVQIEIDPVQESVWPSFTGLKPVSHQTPERLETYLREILNQLSFGLGARNHTTPCDLNKPETVVAETSFVLDGRDSTPLPPAEVLSEIDPVQKSVWPSFTALKSRFHLTLLIGSLSEAWQLDSALLEWSNQMMFIMASVFGGVLITLFIVNDAFRRLEQQGAAQPVLDQNPVEEMKAAKMEHFMEKLMATREIQELKPETAGPTLEQQLRDLERRREEWDRNVRAVEASMQNTLKMVNEWNTDLSSRIRSNQSRFSKLLNNQISSDRDASNQSKQS